jgi:hypothetical protein
MQVKRSIQSALVFSWVLAAPMVSAQQVPNVGRVAPVVQAPPPPPGATPFFVATPPRTRRPSLLREHLRLLDRTLVGLPDRSRDSRITQGLLDIGVGGLEGAIGFAFPSDISGSPSQTQYLLWFQGGYSIARGVVNLVWAPARERLPHAYMQLPTRTGAQRRARVRAGEEALEEIAADGHRRRLLGGIASSVYSLASLGLIYNRQIFDGAPMPEPVAVNGLLIGLVGVQVLVSVVGMFGTSDDERIRQTYLYELQQLRESREADDAEPAVPQSSNAQLDARAKCLMYDPSHDVQIHFFLCICFVSGAYNRVF